MPCSKAAFISGESLLGSKVFPAPMPIFAKRAMSSVSDGSVGQNCRMKLRMLKTCSDVFSSPCVIGFMKSMSGADLGAAVPKKRRKWLHLVAGLDFLYVVDVAGIEQLRAIERQESAQSRSESPPLDPWESRLSSPARQ